MNLSPIAAGLGRLQDWPLDTAALQDWTAQALDLGISSFDIADTDGDGASQARFGAALAAAPGLRNRLQIISKCGIKPVTPNRPAHTIRSYDSSRAHVLASVDASLRALRTDHLDLLLMHRPDLLMDPDELAGTFRQLLAAGKVLRFGLSNHTPGQLAMLRKRHPVAVHQFEFSTLQMRALADGTLEQCLDLGVRPMAWSPLGGGRLFNGGDAQASRVWGVLSELAFRDNVSVPTVAYAWILRHPARPIPVTGTGRAEGLRDAAAALGLQLGAEDWYRIWQASIGHGLP